MKKILASCKNYGNCSLADGKNRLYQTPLELAEGDALICPVCDGKLIVENPEKKLIAVGNIPNWVFIAAASLILLLLLVGIWMANRGELRETEEEPIPEIEEMSTFSSFRDSMQRVNDSLLNLLGNQRASTNASSVESLKANIARLNQEKQQNLVEITRLKKQIAQNPDLKAKYEKRIAMLEEQNQSLQAELDRLYAEVRRLTEENVALRQVNSQLEAEKKELKQTAEAQAAQIARTPTVSVDNASFKIIAKIKRAKITLGKSEMDVYRDNISSNELEKMQALNVYFSIKNILKEGLNNSNLSVVLERDGNILESKSLSINVAPNIYSTQSISFGGINWQRGNYQIKVIEEGKGEVGSSIPFNLPKK